MRYAGFREITLSWIVLSAIAPVRMLRLLPPVIARPPPVGAGPKQSRDAGGRAGLGRPQKGSIRRQNAQQNGDLLSQARKIATRGIPDFIDVDAKVAVHQNIPHSGGLGPWQQGREISNALGDVRQGLAKDLKVVDYPSLNQLVALESCPPSSRVLLNAVDRLERILQPFALSSQRGLASRSRRSLTLGLRPREDTTSTDTPSRAFNSSTSWA